MKPRIVALNHVALHVADVAASTEFYTAVLRLEPIPRPAFSFDGAWFRLGNDQELHLICRGAALDQPPGRDNHFALLVEDIYDWAEHLRQLGISFQGPKPRPDQAPQIFVQDPDGHYIELCGRPQPV